MSDRFYLEISKRDYTALNASLSRLKGPHVNAGNRTASTKAIRPVRKDVKRRVRPISKGIANAIDYVVRTYKNTGTVVAMVGTDSKKLTRSDDGFVYPSNVLQLIELGTVPHRIKAGTGEAGSETTYHKVQKSFFPKGPRPTVLTDVNETQDDTFEFFGKEVAHPGATAQPVLRPAFQSGKSQMEDTWGSVMSAFVEKEFAKGLPK